MSRRLLILDAVLVALFAFGAYQFWLARQAFWAGHSVSSVPAAPETVAAQPVAVGTPATAAADWTEITVRNPFSFDRTDVPIVASQAEAENLGPKPILFGTMSLGDGLIAMMATGQPGNRNARPLHVGELLDGWQLVEIQDKVVIVKAGERRENIVMNDPTAQVPRDASRTVNGSAPSVVQSAPAAAPSNNSRPQAPSRPAAAEERPALPPTPLDANGQPKKGRWVIGPFGNVFVEEDR